MSTQHSRTSNFQPPPYENAVFVSYKWGGEGEKIVNQIEQVLKTRGIKLIRDKRDLGFKSSIRKFMERMGRGTCVIVVINDGYLRSKHCMFELMEIAEAKQFHDRIFPMVLSDADIYDPVKRIEYVRYWEGKRAELVEAMRTVDPANLQGIREDMDLYDRIRDEISGLTSTLGDMNTLTPEIHRQGDYQILVDAIAERLLLLLKDVPSKDPLHQKRIIDRRLRRLDAAMPKECPVGQTTEVRVVIALPNSKGLRAFLPDHTESGELIDKGDVKNAGAPIEFPYDQGTGQYSPAHLQVKIHAPGFKVGKPWQQILVPPDKDSGILTFFLIPRTPQSIGRVSVKLYQDKERAIELGSVTLTTKVSPKQEENEAILWQLIVLPLMASTTPISLSSTEANSINMIGLSKPIEEGLLSRNLSEQNETPDHRLETIVSMQASSAQAAETPAQPAHPANRSQRFNKDWWSCSAGVFIPLLVAIVAAVATIISAIINIYPTLSVVTKNTPVPPSPTPSCMSDVEPLVKFHILKNEREIIAINPKEVYHMPPNSTIEVQLEITAASDVVLATPQCTWTNAGTGTDGEFLQKAGCTVVYQSGHTRIEDAISLQVSQPSCLGLFSYAFFILPEPNLEEVP